MPRSRRARPPAGPPPLAVAEGEGPWPRNPWRWRRAKARGLGMTSGGGSGAGGGAMRRQRSFTERSEHPWERSEAEGSGGPERRPAPGGGPERRGMKRPRAVGRSLRQGWRGHGP